MHYDLTPLAARVLGALIEKERTTPEHYPLTLNSLVSAVNQSSNRDPVMSADAEEVERALEELRAEKLAVRVMTAGARVGKYQHRLLERIELDREEVAVLCVLILRGPQTEGELKSRTERLYPFESLAQIEETLVELAKRDEPLVQRLAPRPGQKGVRWVQLLTGEPGEEAVAAPVVVEEEESRGPTRMERLEQKVEELQEQLATLREEFSAFRREFGE